MKNRHQLMNRLRVESLEDRIYLAAATLPVDVTTGGVSWSSINNTDSGPYSSVSALNISDATLTDGGSDAYDGAFILTVDGVAFRDPDGIVDLTGTTITSDPVTLSGLDTAVQYFFDPNSPTVRALYSFTNNTLGTITASVGVGSDLGSDSSTTIETTSSGDAVYDPSDRYVITSDGAPPSDPVLTFVRFGPGNPVSIPLIAVAPGDDFGGEASEEMTDVYEVTVPAGETRHVMYFGQLADSVGDATTNAATFDTNAGVQNAGLVADLTAQQLSDIVNWDFDGNPAPPSDPIVNLQMGNLPIGGNPVALATTVVTGGASWSDINNSTSGPISTVSGLAISDGTLTGPGLSDAYDGAFMMALNGVTFRDPDGTVDLTGTTLTTDSDNMFGLDASVQYFFDPNSPTVRALYSFKNTSGSHITANVSVAHDLGSDDDTRIETTSSGDTILNADDRFVITSDGDLSSTRDPVLTFVRRGSGDVLETPLVAIGPGGGDPNGDDNSEEFIDTYHLFVPDGQTRRVMVFGQLSESVADALTGAATFATNAAVDTAGLLTGLSNDVLAEIVNWAFDTEPEPTECQTTVTTQEDIVDENDGVNSLREAIICANETPGHQTISLPAGTYNLTIAGSDENAAATGDLDITDDLTIQAGAGENASTVIIDAGGPGGLGDRVFHVGGEGISAEFERLTITGGSSVRFGGGIHVEFSSLTIRESIVTGNSVSDAGVYAYAAGGGISAYGAAIGGGAVNAGFPSSSTSVLIEDSTISGNTVTTTGLADSVAFGGGAAILADDVTVRSSSITGNSVTAEISYGTSFKYGFASGGGAVLQGQNVQVQNTTVSDNTVSVEGFVPPEVVPGAANQGVLPPPPPPSFFGLSEGGGLTLPGNALVQQSMISGNSASTSGSPYTYVHGGGIHHSAKYFGKGGSYGGPLEIRESTISGNSVSSSEGTIPGAVNSSLAAPNVGGGGLFSNSYYSKVSMPLTVINSTISGNSASSEFGDAAGGGMFLYNNHAEVESSTITGNSADLGGGVHTVPYIDSLASAAPDATTAENTGNGYGYGGPPQVHNTIISANTAATAPDYNGEADSQGYNLIGDGSGSSGFGETGDKVGDSESPIDPLLGPLQNNGGPTETHELLTGSPAIDMGDPVDFPPIDQRGVGRPLDGDGNSVATADIGAYEAATVDPLELSLPMMINEGGTVTLTGTFSAGPGARTVTIQWGDGDTDVITLSGTEDSFSIDHTYLDDMPSGPPEVPYVVTVQSTGGPEGTLMETVEVGVKNVPPFFTSLGLNPPSVPSGFETTLVGMYDDPGVLDQHLIDIDIDGDDIYDEVDIPVSGGMFQFSIPINLPPGQRVLQVQIKDDDGAATSATLDLTVTEPPPGAAVQSVHLFYNNSLFDGNNPGADANDDDAIATDKFPFIPGQTSTFGSISSYDKGINGVILYVQDLPDNGADVGADNFDILVGTTDDLNTWAAGPAPQVTVAPGVGPGGADQVTLIFPDDVVEDTYVAIRMLQGAETGLAQTETYLFGSVVGETGQTAVPPPFPFFGRGSGDFASIASDVTPLAQFGTEPIFNPHDINRDGTVAVQDILLTAAAGVNLTVLPEITPFFGAPGVAAFAVDEAVAEDADDLPLNDPIRQSGAHTPVDQRVGQDENNDRDLAFATFGTESESLFDEGSAAAITSGRLAL